MDDASVRQRLLRLAREHRLTPAELAQLVPQDSFTSASLASDEAFQGAASVETLVRVANVFDVDLGWVARGFGAPQPPEIDWLGEPKWTAESLLEQAERTEQVAMLFLRSEEEETYDREPEWEHPVVGIVACFNRTLPGGSRTFTTYEVGHFERLEESSVKGVIELATFCRRAGFSVGWQWRPRLHLRALQGGAQFAVEVVRTPGWRPWEPSELGAARDHGAKE